MHGLIYIYIPYLNVFFLFVFISDVCHMSCTLTSNLLSGNSPDKTVTVLCLASSSLKITVNLTSRKKEVSHYSILSL